MNPTAEYDLIINTVFRMLELRYFHCHPPLQRNLWVWELPALRNVYLVYYEVVYKWLSCSLLSVLYIPHHRFLQRSCGCESISKGFLPKIYVCSSSSMLIIKVCYWPMLNSIGHFLQENYIFHVMHILSALAHI